MKNLYKKKVSEFKRKNKYNIVTDKSTKIPSSYSHINNNYNETENSNFSDNKENNKEKNLSEVNNILKSLKFIRLPDSKYFYDKIRKNSLIIEDFNFIDVEGDGNYDYRALALQLYNDEGNHNIIRVYVYNYFILNYAQYKNQYTFINNHLELLKYIFQKYKLTDFGWEIMNYQLIYD